MTTTPVTHGTILHIWPRDSTGTDDATDAYTLFIPDDQHQGGFTLPEDGGAFDGCKLEWIRTKDNPLVFPAPGRHL